MTAASAPLQTGARPEPPTWLTALRYAIAVAAPVLGFAIPVLPGLAPWVAGLWLPLALAYALVVGWPIALWLHFTGRRSLGHLMLGGAGAGLFPLGLAGLAEPLMLPITLTVLALGGAAAGAIAWGLHRLLALPDALGRGIGLAVGLPALAGVVAALGAGAQLAVDVGQGPVDMSCHNPGRDGRSSIGTVFMAEILVDEAEWPRIRAVAADVGRRQGWDIQDYSQNYDGLRMISMSFCQDSGVRMRIEKRVWTSGRIHDFNKGVRITFLEPPAGVAWQQLARDVMEPLAAAWPGKVRFLDNWHPVEPPNWACRAEATTALCPERHRGAQTANLVNRVP